MALVSAKLNFLGIANLERSFKVEAGLVVRNDSPFPIQVTGVTYKLHLNVRWEEGKEGEQDVQREVDKDDSYAFEITLSERKGYSNKEYIKKLKEAEYNITGRFQAVITYHSNNGVGQATINREFIVPRIQEGGDHYATL